MWLGFLCKARMHKLTFHRLKYSTNPVHYIEHVKHLHNANSAKASRNNRVNIDKCILRLGSKAESLREKPPLLVRLIFPLSPGWEGCNPSPHSCSSKRKGNVEMKEGGSS